MSLLLLAALAKGTNNQPQAPHLNILQFVHAGSFSLWPPSRPSSAIPYSRDAAWQMRTAGYPRLTTLDGGIAVIAFFFIPGF